MKPTGRPRKRKIEHRKHGASALDAALKRGGLDALDGRWSQVRAVREWLAEYTESLGSAAALGVGAQTLLEAAGPERLIVVHVGGILLARPSWIVNRRRRQLSQLAKDYLLAVKHLRETLVVLGLERRQRDVPTIEELSRRLIAERAPEPPGTQAVDVEADEQQDDAQDDEDDGDA
jgi:hypothetical protein